MWRASKQASRAGRWRFIIIWYRLERDRQPATHQAQPRAAGDQRLGSRPCTSERTAVEEEEKAQHRVVLRRPYMLRLTATTAVNLSSRRLQKPERCCIQGDRNQRWSTSRQTPRLVSAQDNEQVTSQPHHVTYTCMHTTLAISFRSLIIDAHHVFCPLLFVASAPVLATLLSYLQQRADVAVSSDSAVLGEARERSRQCCSYPSHQVSTSTSIPHTTSHLVARPHTYILRSTHVLRVQRSAASHCGESDCYLLHRCLTAEMRVMIQQVRPSAGPVRSWRCRLEQQVDSQQTADEWCVWYWRWKRHLQRT